MSALIIQNGKHKGRKVTLPDKEVVLGRDEDCYIRLTSTEVSRKHCALRPTPRGLLVRDLQSQNGTQVNGVVIAGETLLQPADLLRVGPFSFQVEGIRPPKAASDFDDTIAEWLSEGDTSTDIPTVGDTTIVKAADAPQPAAPQAAAGEKPNQAPEPGKPRFEPRFETSAPKVRQHFASVAEEAQDIIRRHLELVAQRARK